MVARNGDLENHVTANLVDLFVVTMLAEVLR